MQSIPSKKQPTKKSAAQARPQPKKHRAKSASPALRKKAREAAAIKQQLLAMKRLAVAALCGVIGFCVILAMTIRAVDDRKRPADSWVAEGAVEIAAPPLENGVGTLDVIQSAPTLAPFVQERTPEPLPTPVATIPQMQTITPEFVLEPTLAPEPVSILLTAVGDCTLGGDVKGVGFQRFRDAVAKHGCEYFLANVRDIFAEDDITIVNLEGPLTSSTELRPNRPFNFKGDPENVRILSSASVEVCNVANNHSQDFSKSGLLETADLLEAANIGVSGYSVVDYEEIRGITVGFVGLTEWDYKVDEVRQIVSDARTTCDLLIVSMHWGLEGSYETTELQKKLGHACVDAGADLVIGNHSHVVGEIELYRDKYILYSLGNFCFGGNGNPSDKDTMIFQQRFYVAADGGVEDGGIRVIPCSISSAKNSNNFQPTPLEGETSARLMKKIARYSRLSGDALVTLEAVPLR